MPWGSYGPGLEALAHEELRLRKRMMINYEHSIENSEL
jgi:hypothetical protein